MVVFNQSIQLPDSLNSLMIDGVFNKSIQLPNRLKTLYINGRFNQSIQFPDSFNYFRNLWWV